MFPSLLLFIVFLQRVFLFFKIIFSHTVSMFPKNLHIFKSPKKNMQIAKSVFNYSNILENIIIKPLATARPEQLCSLIPVHAHWGHEEDQNSRE